ncbi:MAG: 30S ribosomal protein S21 [bacterium]
MKRKKELGPIEVTVDDRGLERAIKVLKKKMAMEGLYKEMKKRRHYEPPSVMKKLKKEEAERRRRKNIKKRRERKERKHIVIK